MTLDRLKPILADKAKEVAAASQSRPLSELQAACADLPPPRDFGAALRRAAGPGCLAIIAESKRQSPSAGKLVSHYDPAAYARRCAEAGAACLSVLTDKGYFGGSAEDLAAARATCDLPVLRKDFIIEPWQVYETRLMGADCLLLIAAALAPGQLAELAQLGARLGLAVLVEVHAEAEIAAALAAGSTLLGVNNRNLSNLRSDLATGVRLIPQLAGPGRQIVAESAIHSGADAAQMLAAGASALLVGEALLRADDLAGKLAKLATPSASC